MHEASLFIEGDRKWEIRRNYHIVPAWFCRGLQILRARFGFLITDEDHEDVYIADRDHLNAVNNDIVEVRIKKGETGRHNTEGEVLRIIERAENTLSALMR